MKKIFFYPHPNLRDRQLDTVRLWPKENVINPEIADQKPWHYSAASTLRKFIPKTWHKYIPAINIKMRPKNAPSDAIVYCWGGIIARGEFIVELDTPYILTGYSVFALRSYKPILRALLLDPRCRQIRCISQACHDTLSHELGEDVGKKAKVYYPLLTDLNQNHVPQLPGDIVKILYISTRFELKAGASVLRIMKALQAKGAKCHLTMVTYLPDEYESQLAELKNITYVKANLPRAELVNLYSTHDIFLHPTYDDSFGMVVWEALAHGQAIVAYDVYAIREMVIQNQNGFITRPPIANWDGIMPTKYHTSNQKLKDAARHMDVSAYEKTLLEYFEHLIENPRLLLQFKQFSQQHFKHLATQPHYFNAT